jgi:uncharacterized protein (DUF1810 family)
MATGEGGGAGATGLERFHEAQDAPGSGISAALGELRTTGKRTHWIWYVFPQLAGLGMSSLARDFAIADGDEALEYLGDPVLRGRLLAAAEAVEGQLQRGQSLVAAMGSRIDATKLVSSLTLFECAGQRLGGEGRSEGERAEAMALVDVAGRVLAAAETQGFPRCAFTLRAVRR